MTADMDMKLTNLAAKILRDAVQAYDPVADLSQALAYAVMLGGFEATGSFSAVTGSFRALTGSFAAAGTDPVGAPPVTLKRVFRLPSRLPGVWLPPEAELAAM